MDFGLGVPIAEACGKTRRTALTELTLVLPQTHAKADDGLVQTRKPGRPKSIEPVIIRFIPDSPKHGKGHHEIPIFLLPLLERMASEEDFRELTSVGAIQAMGISIDPNQPHWHWVLPARSLVKLTDLEICLLTFLVSDLPLLRST